MRDDHRPTPPTPPAGDPDHEHPDHPEQADRREHAARPAAVAGPGRRLDGVDRRRFLIGLGGTGVVVTAPLVARLAASPASPPGLPATGAAATTTPAASVAEASVAAGPVAGRGPRNPYGPLRFHAGDHHVHTQFSPDGLHRVGTMVERGRRHGLDWMVITDHGGVAHHKLALDKVAPEIERARRDHGDILVYQGLEWNIPGADHATVFLPPGRDTLDILKDFEGAFDGNVLAAAGAIERATAPAAEPHALEALRYLDAQVLAGRVPVALMLANHPSRKGLDSPHELRNWRDSAPRVAVGMEGAPGHQAGGIPGRAGGAGDARGSYGSGPSRDSFPGYRPSPASNPYRTYGGFDWMTATVGGVWDALLAEGQGWWVTATSDAHRVHLDHYRPGGGDHDATGSRGDPVDAGRPLAGNAFWPGFYSTTLVAAASRSYGAIMAGLRDGMVVAVHGRLVDGLDVRVRALGEGDRRGATLGGRTFTRRGGDVELTVTVQLAAGPNHGGEVPRLATLDVIAGPVTGPASDRDALTAPATRVVETFEVGRRARGQVTFRHRFRRVERPFYVRLRGGDGRRQSGAGHPLVDTFGDADPWTDLWCYASPVFVDVV